MATAAKALLGGVAQVDGCPWRFVSTKATQHLFLFTHTPLLPGLVSFTWCFFLQLFSTLTHLFRLISSSLSLVLRWLVFTHDRRSPLAFRHGDPSSYIPHQGLQASAALRCTFCPRKLPRTYSSLRCQHGLKFECRLCRRREKKVYFA